MTSRFLLQLFAVPAFAFTLYAADPVAETTKLSRWALNLPDAQTSATPNPELQAARDATREDKRSRAEWAKENPDTIRTARPSTQPRGTKNSRDTLKGSIRQAALMQRAKDGRH